MCLERCERLGISGGRGGGDRAVQFPAWWGSSAWRRRAATSTDAKCRVLFVGPPQAQHSAAGLAHLCHVPKLP